MKLRLPQENIEKLVIVITEGNEGGERNSAFLQQHQEEFNRILMKTRFEMLAKDFYGYLSYIKCGNAINTDKSTKEEVEEQLNIAELLYMLKTSKEDIIISSSINKCKLPTKYTTELVKSLEDEFFDKVLYIPTTQRIEAAPFEGSPNKEHNYPKITEDLIEEKIRYCKSMLRLVEPKGRPISSNNMKIYAAINIFIDYGLTNCTKDLKVVFDCLDHFELIPEEVKLSWSSQGWSKDEEKKNMYQHKKYIKTMYEESKKYCIWFTASAETNHLKQIAERHPFLKKT